MEPKFSPPREKDRKKRSPSPSKGEAGIGWCCNGGGVGGWVWYVLQIFYL